MTAVAKTKTSPSPSMADRKRIAAALDEAKRQSQNVNSIPAVRRARAQADEANRLAAAADEEFHEVFDWYTRQGVDAKLARQFPGVLVLGTGEADYMQWIARCAVTGLPICIGDRVYISGEEGLRTYILADAVTFASGFEKEPVIVDANGEEV